MLNQVRPQHACSVTTPTRRPASSRTATAARPDAEANESVKESAHTTTS